MAQEGGSRLTMSESNDTSRHFDEMLFCGAGDFTRQQIALLHECIDKALVHLSGRQQGPHWHEQPTQGMLDTEQSLNDTADLACEQVARDIAMALTGKEIEFLPTSNRGEQQ